MAKWERDRAKCQQCGNPYSECHDHARAWYPQRVVDFAVMEQKAADWLYDRLHADEPYHNGTFTSWAKDRSTSHPYKFDDGVTVMVTPTDLSPDDKFLTDACAPVLPKGGE